MRGMNQGGKRLLLSLYDPGWLRVWIWENVSFTTKTVVYKPWIWHDRWYQR